MHPDCRTSLDRPLPRSPGSCSPRVHPWRRNGREWERVSAGLGVGEGERLTLMLVKCVWSRRLAGWQQRPAARGGGWRRRRRRRRRRDLMPAASGPTSCAGQAVAQPCCPHAGCCAPQHCRSDAPPKHTHTHTCTLAPVTPVAGPLGRRQRSGKRATRARWPCSQPPFLHL